MHRPTLARLTLAAALALSPVGLAACGDDTVDDPEDVAVDDVQDDPGAASSGFVGAYGSSFYDDVQTYVGQEVSVSAAVNEVLDPQAFTIGAEADPAVEPLLVVWPGEGQVVEEETAVEVTGTVEEAFSVLTVEDELGVDLDDDLFAGYESQPYIVADTVSPSAATTTE